MRARPFIAMKEWIHHFKNYCETMGQKAKWASKGSVHFPTKHIINRVGLRHAHQFRQKRERKKRRKKANARSTKIECKTMNCT